MSRPVTPEEFAAIEAGVADFTVALIPGVGFARLDPPAVSTRYRVRKQSSGYAASESFYVYDLVRKGRVTVNAHRVREGAQADADDLNISDMVRPHAEDPRPYAVRLAEATAVYQEARRG